MQFWQRWSICCRLTMRTRCTRQVYMLNTPAPVCCRLFLLSPNESLPMVVGAMRADLASVTESLFSLIFPWQCSVRLQSVSTPSSDSHNHLAGARFINLLRAL